MAKQNNNQGGKDNNGSKSGQKHSNIKGRETPTPRPPKTQGKPKK